MPYSNKENQKKWALENRDKMRAYRAKWRIKNREIVLKKKKEYYKNNKDKYLLWCRKYKESHREEIRARSRSLACRVWRRKWDKKRRASAIVRVGETISTGIRIALKGKKAGRSWEKLVGYTLDNLMEHLEKLFDDKMNWENQGSYWHIDHIKPQSLFNYKMAGDEEFKKCWALNNLQPLEKITNIIKSNNYEPKT